MYHHHSNVPRPHQQPNQNPDMMTQMGFEFPRPTQLPDELESALAIRGTRDMDHRLMDHRNPSSQHQSQGSVPGISQHGNYSSAPLTSDNQPGHRQGVDWSSYQPPSKLFATPPPSSSQQPPRQTGTRTSMPGWTANVSDSRGQHPQGVRSGGGGSGDSHGLHTPESAGSILASFGLSNEDLEVLSHYPDDQLTPDTLPFILRDIQINKSGNKSRSPEVPSVLSVTQTAGKVIDYGHASRAKEESNARETFRREPLSNERTVKMYPKADKTGRRHVALEQTEPSKHGDRDYRRGSAEHHRNSRSPARELPPQSKSRTLDRDYRREGPKPRPSSETRSDESSRRSLSSSSGSKPHSSSSSSKKLPTPTMISDFSAMSPKVYPHTCSLCHIECDQEKDWVDHINTVNHTAACRDLRNKYPAWKPNVPRPSQHYGDVVHQDPKHPSPSHSSSRSASGSPTRSPPHSKHRVGPRALGQHGKVYSPYQRPRYHHFSDRRLDPRRPSRDHLPERRDRESTGFSPRSSLKRPHGDFSNTNQRPLTSKADGDHTKVLKSVSKKGPNGWLKVNKTAKADDTSAKPPPAKKKKKLGAPTSVDSVADRLVYLTGIPNDATEQEVTDLVSSFGKINNVILMPVSEEEGQQSEGQKASVCMVKAEDALSLSNATELSIRDQPISASTTKKPEGQQQSSDDSKSASGQKTTRAAEDAGGEVDQMTSDEKGLLLISGLPESGWSESDIIQLIQPFVTPCDIIATSQMGKALVSVSSVDVAEEIVKVHTFVPPKINDSELKTIRVRQHVGLNRPVALYNLLMASSDPSPSSYPVGWGRLLVIKNVPTSPSRSSEVKKLVQRFGTVIKSLVVDNMVICQMVTGAVALSVYKRFNTFPCIIQNNQLFFYRKADPRISKVTAAHLDTSEGTSAKVKDDQTAAAAPAADVEQTPAHEEKPEFPAEEPEKDSVDTDDKTKNPEKTSGADETAAENGSAGEIHKDELAKDVSDSSAPPDAKPEDVVDVNENEMSVVEAAVDKDGREDVSVPETGKDEEEVAASETGNENTAAAEETRLSSSDDKEPMVPELPKVTQAMVNVLLVECRTRIPKQADDSATPPCGEKEEAQPEKEEAQPEKEEVQPEKEEAQPEGERSEKAAPTETKTATEEEEKKKQEREKKERDTRKVRETRERDRKDRRPWEKEERGRRERETDERGRRERERRERERKDRERRERERQGRKRGHGDTWTSRASSRSEGFRQNTHRDGRYSQSEEENKTVEEQQQQEEEEFPFNLSDFVTVDEVGEVADLPASLSDVVVSMETTDAEEAAAATDQQETAQDVSMEVNTDMDTAAVAMTESDAVTPTTTTTTTTAECSDGPAPSVLTPDDATPPADDVTPPADDVTPITDDVTAPNDIVPFADDVIPSADDLDPSNDIVTASNSATHNDAPSTQTPEQTSGAAASDSETEPLPVPAPAASVNPPDSTPTPAEEREEGAVNVIQPQEEEEKEEKKEREEKEEEEREEKEEKEEEEAAKKPEDKEATLKKQKEAVSVETVTGKQRESEKTTTTVQITDSSLPPFDPNNPVGLEFLVPKTGFFCKPCNRFFTGSKEAEISHCKTIKHYDNLKKYLETTLKTTVKPDTNSTSAVSLKT